MTRLALPLVLCLLAAPALAAEPVVDKAQADKLAAELKEPFEALGAVVSLASAGEVEAAFSKYAERLIDAPKDDNDFESDFRTGFRRLFKQFPKGVDSLDLVSVRRVSSKSYRLSCIANGRTGPILVEALTYRHSDKWWFRQIGFQPVEAMDANRFHTVSETLPPQILIESVTIPLSPVPSRKLSAVE